jgi:small-conductance mechanosensitive channel
MDLGPLIAGAGVVGVALGFGAQALVRDFLSGFFILSEDQFGVGEVVEITAPGKQVTGKVESMSLRITTVRSFDGTQHIVPNGNIQVVGNRSRGWARAIVDVQLAWRQDLEEARRVLEELFEDVPGQDDRLRSWIVDGPRVLGVEAIDDGSVALRVVADTRPTRRAEVERSLREAIKVRFAERGIVTAGTPEAALVEAGTPEG